MPIPVRARRLGAGSCHACHDAALRRASVSSTDRRRRIVHVHDQFCRISGYARAELVGRSHAMLYSGTHGPAFFGQLWRIIAGGTP